MRKRRRRSGDDKPPLLAPGMVWTTSKRRKAHTTWCDVMNGTWLEGYTPLQVPLREMAGVPVCKLCSGEVDDDPRELPRFDRIETKLDRLIELVESLAARLDDPPPPY